MNQRGGQSPGAGRSIVNELAMRWDLRWRLKLYRKEHQQWDLDIGDFTFNYW